MRQKRISIGVAGLGRIGWGFHCAQIARSADFRLAAVADPDTARRHEAKAHYGCSTFADVSGMLNDGGLDAVVIASPTNLHKPQALEALRRGLHVFLEKPMGLDMREATAIVKAARRADRVLTVYQPLRAAAWFQQASRLLNLGVIGKVYHVRIGMFRFARRNDWQCLSQFGGGMLNNYGAHALDQALSLTGGNVRQIFCSLRQVASLGDTEDVVKVIYETRNGKIGEVDINQACVTAPYEFEAYGTRGVLRKEGDQLMVRHLMGRLGVKHLDSALTSANRAYPSDEVQTAERSIPVDLRYAVDVYRDLAHAIRSRKEPFVKPKETLAVMRLITRCRTVSSGIRRMPLDSI